MAVTRLGALDELGAGQMGRGLIPFTPTTLLLPLFAFLGIYGGGRHQKFLVVGSLLWMGLNLIAISKFRAWFGGVSFGPRFQTETTLAIFTIFVVGVHVLRQIRPGWSGKSLLVLSLLGGMAFHNHTINGLFERSSYLWSFVAVRPEGKGFSWRFPQFLAGRNMIEEMRITSKIYDKKEL